MGLLSDLFSSQAHKVMLKIESERWTFSFIENSYMLSANTSLTEKCASTSLTLYPSVMKEFTGINCIATLTDSYYDANPHENLG
jgi:hypothetical protein